MKKYILLFCLMIFSLGMHAQQASIQGILLSADKREPIASAMISLQEQQKFAVSDGQGRFVLKGLQEDLINIKVEHVAYKNVQQQIELGAGENKVEILMEEATFIAEEIVVSAGFFTGRDQVAYKVESVNVEEIAASGAHNMMEALSHIPGVSQISYGPAVGKPVIRGLSFSRVMTIYQGLRFENQQWGEDHGLGLNDQGIARVEVVKGPASLMYGSGAIGGVVNIIDREPAEKPLEGYAGVNIYSNTLGLRSDAGLRGGASNGVFWNLEGNMQAHSDYRDGNNRITGNSRFTSRMLKAGAGLQESWGSSKLTYTYNQQVPGIIEEFEMQETLATNPWDKSLQVPYQNITDHLLTAQNVFNIGTSKLRLNLGQHLNLREENEEAMGKVDLGLRLHTSTYDIKYNFSLDPRLELISGIQGFYQVNTNMEGAEEILLPDARQWDNGLYGLLMYDLGSLNLQGGLRYDHRKTQADVRQLEGFELQSAPVSGRLERSFSGYTGSMGATYKFNQHLLLRSNLASGFRAPDLAELFSNGEHPGTNRFERGDASFGREQNLEWDLSTLYRREGFAFELAGYYNYVKNYIFFSPTDERIEERLQVWQFEQDDVALWGGEAGLSWQPALLPWLEHKLSFSLVRAERLGTGKPLPLIPADRLENVLRLKARELQGIRAPYAMLRVQQVFAQYRTGRFEQFTDGYTLSSLAAGGEIDFLGRELNLKLMCQNLFNVAYMDHLAITRPFAVPNMGRNITLSLRVSF